MSQEKIEARIELLKQEHVKAEAHVKLLSEQLKKTKAHVLMITGHMNEANYNLQELKALIPDNTIVEDEVANGDTNIQSA